MNELKQRKTENGIDYVLVGNYYIPDLKLSEENHPIGKFGRLHRDFLKEIYPARYNELILSCELWSYLADVNEQAQERMENWMVSVFYRQTRKYGGIQRGQTAPFGTQLCMAKCSVLYALSALL